MSDDGQPDAIEAAIRTHISGLEALGVANLNDWRSPTNRDVKHLLGLIDRLRAVPAEAPRDWQPLALAIEKVFSRWGSHESLTAEELAMHITTELPKRPSIERFCPHGNAPPSACPHC